MLENCIFWKNANSAGGPSNVYSASATATVSYVAIEGGFIATSWSNVNALLIEGAGNLNVNPLFPDPLTGAWSAAGVFDAESGQTRLTHSSANWSTNGLAAQLVKPGGSTSYQYYIASNTATTIYMWGNAASAATNGALYAIYDYHVQSRDGRWTAIGWTRDTVTSPCIDAGNPASDYSLEPVYNGKRINLGAYGNTDEASKSFLASGGVISVR